MSRFTSTHWSWHQTPTYAQDNTATCQKLPCKFSAVCTCPHVWTWTYCAACAENFIFIMLASTRHTHHFTHAHDTVGFSVIQHAKVCARMQRVGATGQGEGHGACVLVLGEHAAVRVGQCTGQQRGCGVLHVPLMSFLGQARPWGELISKQATERSPYSPLLLLLLLLLAVQLITLSASLYCFLFLSVSIAVNCLSLRLYTSLHSLCLSFSISLTVVGSKMGFDFSHRHKQFGQQVKSWTDRLAIAAAL